MKNCAAFIGDPFIALCGDRVLGQRKRRILRKVFRVVSGAQKSETYMTEIAQRLTMGSNVSAPVVLNKIRESARSA